MNNRITSIDIAKGLAIISVVQGHIQNNLSINTFIFLIHMVFFLFISGLFMNSDKYETIQDFTSFLIRRFKRLCIPFILINVIFTLLHNFFIKINFYTNSETFFINNNNAHLSCGLQQIYTAKVMAIKSFWALLMARTEILAGITWFLPALFYASGLIVAVIILAKKFKYNKFLYQILAILILGEVGYYCFIHNIDVYHVGRILSCIIPIYIGVLCHKYLNEFSTFGIREFLISSSILLVLNTILKNKIMLINNSYYDPLLLIILTILSFMFFVSLSNLIEKYNFSSFLSYIGKNTLPILCLHPISFKIITLLQIIIYKDPIIRLASFQTYNTTGLWGIAYLIIGVLVPIILNELYKILKRGFIK